MKDELEKSSKSMLTQFNYGQLCGIFSSLCAIMLAYEDWFLAIMSGILAILIMIFKSDCFSK